MLDNHFNSLFSGKPAYASTGSTRKVEPIWSLMKKEMMGWQWSQKKGSKTVVV